MKIERLRNAARPVCLILRPKAQMHNLKVICQKGEYCNRETLEDLV